MPAADLHSTVSPRDASDDSRSTFAPASFGTPVTDAIDDAPGDYGSGNTITPKIEAAHSTGTPSRPKSVLVEVLDHTGTPIGSFTTPSLTTTDTVHAGSAIDVSTYSAANIAAFQIRFTPQEGGGMPEAIDILIDHVFATLDYSLGDTPVSQTSGLRRVIEAEVAQPADMRRAVEAEVGQSVDLSRALDVEVQAAVDLRRAIDTAVQAATDLRRDVEAEVAGAADIRRGIEGAVQQAADLRRALDASLSATLDMHRQLGAIELGDIERFTLEIAAVARVTVEGAVQRAAIEIPGVERIVVEAAA